MIEIEKYLLMSSVSFAEYLMISGIFYILCYIIYRKSLASAKIQNEAVLNKVIQREIYNSLVSSLIMSFIVFWITDTLIVNYTKLYYNIDDYGLAWLLASVPVGLLIHDTYFYWLHRLLHDKRIFRYVHIIHHKSKNPSPFASYSFHILEAVGEGLIIPLLLFVIPLHPIAVYSFLISSFIINVYGHLGYEIAPKGFRKSFLFNILNSSVYHNLHHSKFKGNYGLYFRFWDRIMHTENPYYTQIYDEIQKKRFVS
jgi:lathosterol oxidase